MSQDSNLGPKEKKKRLRRYVPVRGGSVWEACMNDLCGTLVKELHGGNNRKSRPWNTRQTSYQQTYNLKRQKLTNGRTGAGNETARLLANRAEQVIYATINILKSAKLGIYRVIAHWIASL